MKFLCELNDLPCPGSREFTLENERIFVIRKEESIKAFVNSCPHTGMPLNWQPHRFLDADQHYIQCDMHMALFEPESGKCIAGPCTGEHLQPRSLHLEDDRVFLSDVK